MESDEMKLIDTKYEGEDIDLEDELAELPLPKKGKSKSNSKTKNKDNKRRTSSVWRFFHTLQKVEKSLLANERSVEGNILLLEHMILEI